MIKIEKRRSWKSILGMEPKFQVNGSILGYISGCHLWDEKKLFFSKRFWWNISTNFFNLLFKPVYLPYHNLLGNLWPFQQLIDQNKDSDRTKTCPYTYRYKILRENFGTYLSLPCSVGWCFCVSLHFLAFTIFIRLIQSKSASIFGFLLCILLQKYDVWYHFIYKMSKIVCHHCHFLTYYALFTVICFPALPLLSGDLSLLCSACWNRKIMWHIKKKTFEETWLWFLI